MSFKSVEFGHQTGEPFSARFRCHLVVKPFQDGFDIGFRFFGDDDSIHLIIRLGSECRISEPALLAPFAPV